MVKKLKYCLPLNQWNNFNKTWYVASRTTAYHSLFKLLTSVDLDLFYGKVKFWNLVFYIEQCDKDGFFGNHYSL